VKNPRICGFLALEDGTDRLSQNAGKELPLYAESYPRKAETSLFSLSQYVTIQEHVVHG
jgi:hypothetical protein